MSIIGWLAIGGTVVILVLGILDEYYKRYGRK